MGVALEVEEEKKVVGDSNHLVSSSSNLLVVGRKEAPEGVSSLLRTRLARLPVEVATSEATAAVAEFLLCCLPATETAGLNLHEVDRKRVASGAARGSVV